jgi:two-component system response regulator FixJ
MSTAKLLIAVIDDDADVLKSLGRLLRSLGYCVLGFSSGPEYLNSMDRVRPDCIILDMQMPEMNGAELQAEIVRRESSVLFITAHDDPRAHQVAKRAGAPLLLKPFPENLLISAVASAANRSAAVVG